MGSSIADQERIQELEADITELREELDKSREETKTVSRGQHYFGP